MTDEVYRMGTSLADLDGPEPPEDSPDFLMYHFWKEIGLFVGSGFVTVGAMFVTIATSWTGDHLAREPGLHRGMDVGFGFMAFGMAGMLLHLVRNCTILIYGRILYRGEEPYLMEEAPPPAKAMRPFIRSTDWDFLFQALVAVVTWIVAFAVYR